MKKLTLASFCLLVSLSCTDARNESLQVTFDLPTSDQLESTATGLCTCVPQTQAQATYIPSGFLELNPLLNNSAQYTLNLQTENYLDTQTFSDYNGTTISGQQRNDFHVNSAVITYLDTEGILPDPGPTTALVSADVRPGGLESSSCVPVQAVPNSVAAGWHTALANSKADGGVGSDVVVLQVQLFGTLGSGEQNETGYFYFPLTVCDDCLHQLPCSGLDERLVGNGHGPCCASQDFSVTCEHCGNFGEPCCQGNVCNSGGDAGLQCTALTVTTVEFCSPYNDAESSACLQPTGG